MCVLIPSDACRLNVWTAKCPAAWRKTGKKMRRHLNEVTRRTSLGLQHASYLENSLDGYHVLDAGCMARLEFWKAHQAPPRTFSSLT